MREATFSAELKLDHSVNSAEKRIVLNEMATSIGLKPEQVKKQTEKYKTYDLGKLQIHLHFYRNPSFSMRIQEESLLAKANRTANDLFNLLYTRFGKSVKLADVSVDYDVNATKGLNPVRGLIDSQALSRMNTRLKAGFSAIGLVLETKLDGWDTIVLLARGSSNKPFEVHIFSHRELTGGMQWDVFTKQAEGSAKLIKDLMRAIPGVS